MSPAFTVYVVSAVFVLYSSSARYPRFITFSVGTYSCLISTSSANSQEMVFSSAVLLWSWLSSSSSAPS